MRQLGLWVAALQCACVGHIGDDDLSPFGPSPTGNESQVVCTGATPNVGATPLRRLTRSQYAHAVRDLLHQDIAPDALGPDEKVGPFDSNAVTPVGELEVQKYMNVAEEVASAAVASISDLLPCTAQDDACAASFIRDFGRRAYRRPLSDGERASYQALFATGVELGGFAYGIQLVIQGMLQSPSFLYHVELGESADPDASVVLLSPYEIASRLSFFLWGTTPDDELLDAAEHGDLADPAILRAAAERMLDDDRSRVAVASFHVQWLKLDDIEHLEKDAEVYPTFDGALASAMKAETEQFADYVVRRGDGTLTTLLTAPYSFPDGPLFDLYGVQPPPGYDGSEPLDLDPAERGGLLTQASVLAVHAHRTDTSPVARGVFVRENLLCQPLPPPPPNVNPMLPDVGPDATTRERFAAHEADPVCASCHRLIDPIGLSFERYDGIGRYRDTQNGAVIDASGSLTDTSDIDGPFEGPLELGARLATSIDVQECVTRQWFRFALGRLEQEQDVCSLSTTRDAFIESGLDVRELLFTIVTSDAFRYRPADVAPEEGTP